MSKEVPHLLTNLNLEEISAVNAGANKGAKIILRKSESDIMETKDRVNLITKLAEYLNIGKKDGDSLVIETGAMNQGLVEVFKSLAPYVDESVDISKGSKFGDFLARERDKSDLTNAQLGTAAGISESTVAQIIAGSITRPPDNRLRGFARALDGVSFEQLSNLLPEESNMSKSNEELSAEVSALTKRLDASQELNTVTQAISKASTSVDVDAILSKVKTDDESTVKSLKERAEARKAELVKASGKADMDQFRTKLPKSLQKAFDDMDDDERLSFMSKFSKSDGADPIAKALETVTAENVTMKKRLDVMESESEIAKAEVEFAALKGYVNLTEFIPSIIKLRKLDKDAAEVMITQTKALAKQALEGGLFKVLGSGGDGDSDAGADLDKAVKKYRAENTDCPSDEIAMTKVLEDPANADLYTKYLEEQEQEAG